MTQAQLAEAVGIASETLSRIETGHQKVVSVPLARRLASTFGVEVAELFREHGARDEGELRAPERALLALVRDLPDADVSDLVRALRTLVRVSRDIGAGPARPYPTRSKRRSRRRGE